MYHPGYCSILDLDSKRLRGPGGLLRPVGPLLLYQHQIPPVFREQEHLEEVWGLVLEDGPIPRFRLLEGQQLEAVALFDVDEYDVAQDQRGKLGRALPLGVTVGDKGFLVVGKPELRSLRVRDE